MPIKTFRPYTPSRRTITVSDYSDITKTTPEKSLTKGLRKTGGRNNTGMIMVRHIGGGHRRAYRQIDFKREKYGIPAKVVSIEYDPNRSARICLLNYAHRRSFHLTLTINNNYHLEIVVLFSS